MFKIIFKSLKNRICNIIPNNFSLNLIIISIIIIYHIYQSIYYPLHDFANYYYSAKLIINGKFSSSIYFPDFFNREIISYGLKDNFSSFAPNTPFLALIFTPLTYFDPFHAKFIFHILSGIGFILTLIRLHKIFNFDNRILFLIPIIFFIPIRNEILFGQVYFLMFFLLSEIYIAWFKEKKLTAAFILSFAVLFKLFPIHFFALFLFKKEWKILFGAIFFTLLLLIFSLFFIDWKVWYFFLIEVLPKANKGEIASSFVDNYQSLTMFLKRFFVYHESENLSPFINNESIYYSINFGVKISFLFIGLLLAKKTTEKYKNFVFWIFYCFLISPYGSTYSMILFLFILFWSLQQNSKIIFYIVFLLFLTCNLPTYLILNFSFPFSFIRLFLFAFILITFLIKITEFNQLKSLTLVFVIFSVLSYFIFPKKRINSRQMLPANSPILINDLKVSKNEISYQFFNQKGFQNATSDEDYQNIRSLPIINRQVWFNKKQVTNDNSFKKNAWLIDDYMVVYLSDLDRGIGFYTLRLIILNDDI